VVERASGYRQFYLYDLEGEQLAQLTRATGASSSWTRRRIQRLCLFRPPEKSPLNATSTRVHLRNRVTRLTKARQTPQFLRPMLPLLTTPIRTLDATAPGPLPRRWLAYRYYYENKGAELRTTSIFHGNSQREVAGRSSQSMQIIQPPDFILKRNIPCCLHVW